MDSFLMSCWWTYLRAIALVGLKIQKVQKFIQYSIRNTLIRLCITLHIYSYCNFVFYYFLNFPILLICFSLFSLWNEDRLLLFSRKDKPTQRNTNTPTRTNQHRDTQHTPTRTNLQIDYCELDKPTHANQRWWLVDRLINADGLWIDGGDVVYRSKVDWWWRLVFLGRRNWIGGSVLVEEIKLVIREEIR